MVPAHEYNRVVSEQIRLVEDCYALAIAQHVPISHWPDTIAAARKLMKDPEEWKRLGQKVPAALLPPNV